MRRIILPFLLFTGFISKAQTDSSLSAMMNDDQVSSGKVPTKIFYSQKLINSNTVEMLKKGHMEFRVLHNFGDVAGVRGGIKNFFGLDGAEDIKISFQLALSDKLNLIFARDRGGQRDEGGFKARDDWRQLWELGLKTSFMEQRENDPSHPLSIGLYANAVFSSMKIDSLQQTRKAENSFKNFSDRGSWMAQLMIAKKIGKVSLQFTPTLVHTNLVINGDDKNVLALAGAIRIPIVKKFSLIADYYHPMRSGHARDTLRARNIGVHDIFGIGFEMITAGHVFHFNVTNSTNLLENRFIPRTVTSWGKGQYRWGFTIARDFIVFRKKK